LSNTTGASNTANGVNALNKNTTGANNTANGVNALFNNTTGVENTANGVNALGKNTTGNFNTANGVSALLNNTTGSSNTANGLQALLHNTTGSLNTATGTNALLSNTTGSNNLANGANALQNNTTGINNMATGASALSANTTGFFNMANGSNAMAHNTTGSFNVAEGLNSLFFNTTGNSNIALGVSAGINLTTGSNNIDIGGLGVAGEANTIRVGRVGTQQATFVAGISGKTVAGGVGVIIDSTGHLGTIVSSARFKDEIKPMDKASEAILALKPVTFRYKHELDPEGIQQFGLVAEEVEKVNPDLVARDDQGKIYTVRYEAVNAMLLNEFLKEHRKVQELEATATEQQQAIKALTAGLKEQASQIQKVSAQVEVSKPAPRTVGNDQ
jgi:Chaperone of endosialidase